jgi:carboxyl-terminal processing protease
MKGKLIWFSVAFLMVSGIVAFKTVQENDRYFQIVKNLDIFATLFKEVNAYYVDEVNPNQLIKVGIDAMLNSLDPYTTYIPEDDIEDYMTIATGEYGGIGAVIQRKQGINTVIMPHKGSPADRAGLKIGDQILEINGISLEGKNSEDISRLLDGAARSDIELLIKRFDREEPFKVSVRREKITLPNVSYSGMVTEDIGMIRLTDFTTKAGKEVSNALDDLKADGAEKIILDLRGNPGGLLDEAINVSNVFVGKGKEIVSTRGKLETWTRVYRAPFEATDTRIPLVVLIDNMSASAAEIVAGVMQDYDRGVLVGRKTFGKGLVQQTRPLSYNSQLKVTTAKYYIPSGRCIQAIDYSTRNEDGSVGKIADSLKSEFKTKNGRFVYDGGGLDPDIPIESYRYAPISYTLIRKDHIFNYATSYFYSHETIEAARDFDLTDVEYESFVNWLSDKDYSYTTKVESSLDKLIEVAKEEKYYEDIQGQIYELRDAALKNKEEDLYNFKTEILALLEQEIASRYYLQEGALESTFNIDEDITTAIEILNDEKRYRQLLAGSEQ